jgi:integrase
MSKTRNDLNILNTRKPVVVQTAVSVTANEIDLFLESIKSAATREVYAQAIRQFETATGFTLAKESTDAKTLQKALIAYIVTAKNEGTSYSRINGIVSALLKYCDAYEIEVKAKKVRSFLPEHVRVVQDRIYTKAELRTLLDASSIRSRATILLLISTGARAGAIPSLKIKHLSKLPDGRYRVVLYAGAMGQEVISFLTLEASQALERYFVARRAEGENITADSPVIRQEFSANKIRKMEPLSFKGIVGLITEVSVRSGLREKKNGKRQEVMLLHNFRKFNNTALVRAGVKPVVVEVLQGREIGIQKNYLRFGEEELYAEFLKAEPELTISEEPALRRELENAKIDKETMSGLKERIKVLEEKNARLFEIAQGAVMREHERKNKPLTLAEQAEHDKQLVEDYEKEFM